MERTHIQHTIMQRLDEIESGAEKIDAALTYARAIAPEKTFLELSEGWNSFKEFRAEIRRIRKEMEVETMTELITKARREVGEE